MGVLRTRRDGWTGVGGSRSHQFRRWGILWAVQAPVGRARRRSVSLSPLQASMPAQRLVLKFGGTSVGSGHAIGGAGRIAADLRRAGHPLIVVTSAMSTVTDALLGGAA